MAETSGKLRQKISSALAASVGLSVLFLVVYGGTNWFTAQRGDVGTIFFEWERHLPFVPWTIVPYMSIDLLFVAAPFLCRTGEELGTFVRRIAAGIVVAAACFLAFPLRFGFERPSTDGWLGAFFDWFRTMDALHITLGALLLVTYARHTRGALRVAVIGWFVLIWASAVLTHQHHVLDVVGGFALAGYCFYFLREAPPRLPVIQNQRVSSYYLLGAGAVLVVAVNIWPWGAVLLWPVVSLGIVAWLTPAAGREFTGSGMGCCRGARAGRLGRVSLGSISRVSITGGSVAPGMR